MAAEPIRSSVHHLPAVASWSSWGQSLPLIRERGIWHIRDSANETAARRASHPLALERRQQDRRSIHLVGAIPSFGSGPTPKTEPRKTSKRSKWDKRIHRKVLPYFVLHQIKGRAVGAGWTCWESIIATFRHQRDILQVHPHLVDGLHWRQLKSGRQPQTNVSTR